MRKLKEPNEVAFGSHHEDDWYRDESEKSRSDEFWSEFEDDLENKVKQLRSTEAARNWFKDKILDYLRKYSAELAKGMENGIYLWGCGDEDLWEKIKYIIAFDTDYSYVEDFDDDAPCQDEDGDYFTSNAYLEDEEGFRYDIMRECNKCILEGAALCKKIGSPAYDTWIEAMITLNDRYTASKEYKAVDLIAQAHPRTWADLCTWIHMNPPHNEKKKAVKKKKAKK